MNVNCIQDSNIVNIDVYFIKMFNKNVLGSVASIKSNKNHSLNLSIGGLKNKMF